MMYVPYMDVLYYNLSMAALIFLEPILVPAVIYLYIFYNCFRIKIAVTELQEQSELLPMNH